MLTSQFLGVMMFQDAITKHPNLDGKPNLFDLNEEVKVENTHFYLLSNQQVYSSKDVHVLYAGDAFERKKATKLNAEQIFKLYCSYPEDFAKLIGGSYSVIILYQDTKRIEVFRDPLGLQPFYYSLESDRIIFSSRMQWLIDLNITLTPNLKYINHYLTNQIPQTHDLTCYSEIKRIKPNTVCLISDFSLKELRPVHNFYSKNTGISKAKKFDYYLQNCRKALISSLKGNLNNKRKEVGIQFSGGLDSSLLLSTIQKSGYFDDYILIPTYSALTDYQYSFNEKVKDERKTIEMLIRIENYPEATPISSEDIPIEAFSIEYYNNLLIGKMAELVRKNGSNVLVSGFGGDECISYAGTPRYLYQALKKGKISEFAEALKIFGLKRSVMSIIRGNEALLSLVCYIKPDWKKYKIQNEFNITQDIPIEDYDSADTFNDMILQLVRQPFISWRVEREKEMAWNKGVEMVYPLLDLELIQSYFSIPIGYKYYQRKSRAIAKELIQPYVTRNHWNTKSSVGTVPFMYFLLQKEYKKIDVNPLISELASTLGINLKQFAKPRISDEHASILYSEKYFRLNDLKQFLKADNAFWI